MIEEWFKRGRLNKRDFKHLFVFLKINAINMATIVAFNTTVQRIISEVEKMDHLEQESILAYLRARKVQGRPAKNLASIAKPLGMSTINSIKHKSRK